MQINLNSKKVSSDKLKKKVLETRHFFILSSRTISWLFVLPLIIAMKTLYVIRFIYSEACFWFAKGHFLFST